MTWWNSPKVTSRSDSPSGSNSARSTSSWNGRRAEIGECSFISWTYLEGGASLTLLVAILPANCPRLWAVGTRDQGRTPGFVVLVWAVTALLLTASVVAGNGALSGASEGCSLSSSPSPAGQGSCSHS